MKLQVCGDGNFTNHALCGRTTNILGSAADFDHPLFWGVNWGHHYMGGNYLAEMWTIVYCLEAKSAPPNSMNITYILL